MHFTSNLQDTDRKGGTFCLGCASRRLVSQSPS
ncbi:MAG: hypothetical protein ACE5HN_08035 [Nitrospiria bacterium]